MTSNQSLDQEEAFALDAYGALPRSQPPAALDARILAAAHAANARVARSPRRWTPGLATAAVAVLAVGIAWRGMDSRQPDLPVSRELAVPTMQPAFKTESAATSQETSDADGAGSAERDRAAEPASAVVPAAAPTLSSADWNAQGSVREQKREVAADATQAEARSRVSNDAEHEAGKAAAPKPFPAAPAESISVTGVEEPEQLKAPAQAAVAESAPTDQAVPEFDVQAAAPPLSQPESAPPSEVAERADSAGARQESLTFGSAGRESTPAPMGAAAPPAAVAPQATVSSLGSVTEQGIHAGTTSLGDAVVAARRALSRGEHAETRRLCRAIAARFGKARLPEDLWPYAES